MNREILFRGKRVDNGEPLDPNGKKWATTMCHAWYIWEKGSTTEPVVRWL